MRSRRKKLALLLPAGVVALGMLAFVWAMGIGSSGAQQGAMQDCPQPGNWSIAVWDGPSGTDTESALDTCADTTVVAAYYLDPETQGWLRWFAGRPEISNLSTLDELQGMLALGTAPALTFAVDESVTPAVGELPGFEDGVPRPLASIVDELGNQADFVADELILVTDDPAALDAFLARWEGEVLLTFDPAEYDLTGMSPMYLVRINTSLAEAYASALTLTVASALEADLRALTQEGQGAHRVSSQEGLDLLAAAASEAVDGLDVGVNWVGQGTAFRDRVTTEAPTGPSSYSTNAYNWNFLNAGSVQDIGVTEAWTALEKTGRLSNTVRIAILDMGFAPDADFPAGWTAISNVPFTSPTDTESLGGGWHGTNVVGAGMGVPDNDWGGAGVAGPIAEPILVFTLYDFFTSIGAVYEAVGLGADIINMSYGAPVPAILSWSVSWFEVATVDARGLGVLLFASAGNGGNDEIGDDVDNPEGVWHMPCENAGVICVGGLAPHSQSRASYSNFGTAVTGDTVDIFAPGTVWVGPDPDSAGNYAQVFNGTSAASPYAAGVAALIWAADPSLSAGEVESILYVTAHSSPDGLVDRYVNAYDAVVMALGNAPPDISITSPADGSSHSRGSESISFTAEATDPEDGILIGGSVVWTSSVDGEIGTGSLVQRPDLSFGTHTIAATATDSGGFSDSESITITIVNDPPTVEITNPSDGDEFFQAQSINLRGESSDPNNIPTGGPLPDDQVEWRIDGTPFTTGHNASIPGGTLSLGTHTISFTGSDGEFEDTDTITITILANPPDLPPDVQITSPDHSQHFVAGPGYYAEVTLEGEAHDPEDGWLTGASLVWTTSINGGAPQTLGTGESLTVQLEWLGPCGFDTTYDITLTATDSFGNTVTDTITVTVGYLC